MYTNLVIFSHFRSLSIRKSACVNVFLARFRKLVDKYYAEKPFFTVSTDRMMSKPVATERKIMKKPLFLQGESSRVFGTREHGHVLQQDKIASEKCKVLRDQVTMCPCCLSQRSSSAVCQTNQISFTCIAYGWRSWNLNYQSGFSRREKLYCPDVVIVSLQERNWNQVTFLTGDGIKYLRKWIYSCQNGIRPKKVKNMKHIVPSSF